MINEQKRITSFENMLFMKRLLEFEKLFAYGILGYVAILDQLFLKIFPHHRLNGLDSVLAVFCVLLLVI